MPRWSPKSPGEVQVPISTSLTHRLMSEGQSVLVPGTSEDSSMLNSTASISGVQDLGVVRELVLDMAAPEPDQRRLHPARIEEVVGHVEKADDAVRRAQAAGRRDLAGGVEAEAASRPRSGRPAAAPARRRAGSRSRRSAPSRLFCWPLAALTSSVRMQAGALERLHVGRDGRLRQAQVPADLVDVHRPAAAQGMEDVQPHRRRQPLDEVDVVLRVDRQEPALRRARRHQGRPSLYRRSHLYRRIGFCPRRAQRGAGRVARVAPML